MAETAGMKEPAAYAMCVLGGKASPTAADVKAVIEAAGGTADEQLTALCAAMEGKSFAEMCAAGMEKIKDVPMGGGGGGGGGGGAAAAARGEEEEGGGRGGEIDMGGGMDVPFIAILKKMVRLGQKIATLVFIA
ncbi:hypothetical protein JL720_4788 [Aureococcus anophagefferens]|nr:hypothetical protein JL720_4788 [Aureococcus anophagefferens]